MLTYAGLGEFYEIGLDKGNEPLSVTGFDVFLGFVSKHERIGYKE